MRKTQVPKHPLNVFLEKDTYERLRAASASDNRTISGQIRFLVEQYLSSTCGAAAPSPLAGRPAPPVDHEQA